MESPKFNNAEIQRECKIVSEKIQQMHNRVSEMLVGRKARIISDFNGQLHGTSKKSMQGSVITIKYISIDSNGCQVWNGDFGRNCFISVNEVEFLDSES